MVVCSLSDGVDRGIVESRVDQDMSGVYFPKLRLPEMCKDCNLILDLRASMYCPVSDKFVGFDDTPEMAGCPGLPVPDHGRLIDADALYKEAFKRSETRDGYYNCLDPVISCYIIDNAPTIIPAEGGE